MGPFEFTTGIIAILCGTLIAITAIMKGKTTKARRQMDAEETRMIQEFHKNLSLLEDRMEALETILLDRERGKKKTT